MSWTEMAIYAALYVLVMYFGYAYFGRKQSARRTDIQEPLILYPSANENYEKPRLGTGLGRTQPPTGTFVKLSSQRKVS